MIVPNGEETNCFSQQEVTTVIDISFTDTEMTNGMLNTLKNVSDSESCLARLALYRLVHGPDDSNSNSKPNAMCCPSLVRFDGYKVEFDI